MLKRLTRNKKRSHHILRDRVALIDKCPECVVPCDNIYEMFYVVDAQPQYVLP